MSHLVPTLAALYCTTHDLISEACAVERQFVVYGRAGAGRSYALETLGTTQNPHAFLQALYSKRLSQFGDFPVIS